MGGEKHGLTDDYQGDTEQPEDKVRRNQQSVGCISTSDSRAIKQADLNDSGHVIEVFGRVGLRVGNSGEKRKRVCLGDHEVEQL